MTRPVKVRDDYSRDISSLHRIASAVKIDERIPVEGREYVVSHLHRAIQKLMSYELADISEPDDAPESGPVVPGDESSLG